MDGALKLCFKVLLQILLDYVAEFEVVVLHFLVNLGTKFIFWYLFYYTSCRRLLLDNRPNAYFIPSISRLIFRSCRDSLCPLPYTNNCYRSKLPSKESSPTSSESQHGVVAILLDGLYSSDCW